MRVLIAEPAEPLSRTHPSDRAPLRVGLVQHRWRPDAAELTRVLNDGIARAADAGASAVFLPEITLLRYPADVPAGPAPGESAEDLLTGPTMQLAAEAARTHGIFVHASLYEKAPADALGLDDGLGYNTAILVAPSGELVGRTRKMHIPISAGYYEDTYFRPGPASPDDAYPVARASACRPAGTSGSRRWPATTHWAARRSWSIRRRSARNRSSRTSTPSRCGST